MRHIDVHAHLAPQILWQAFERGQDWHGMEHETRGEAEFIVGNGKRILINSPKIRYTPEQRLADMDAEGTDVQVVSIHTPLFPYHWETATAIQASREVNDEIADMTRQWPDRFAGMATLPMQDVDAATAELERAVNVLGLKGAELDMVVNGLNWDEPRFMPLFKAAEELGALLFFHPQPQDNIVAVERTLRYGIPNSVGVVLEDALVVATLICGGILDECPNLKVCIAHGGGGACFAHGAHRSRLAGPVRSPRQHPQAPQRLPESDLLRLPHQQRGRSAFPHRHRRRRPCRHRQRLAFRRLGPITRRMARGSAESVARRERKDRLAQPGIAARHLILVRKNRHSRESRRCACGARESS